jgi:hypothetical protein
VIVVRKSFQSSPMFPKMLRLSRPDIASYYREASYLNNNFFDNLERPLKDKHYGGKCPGPFL